MINPQWLKLPISRINLHGPKDVRAILRFILNNSLRKHAYSNILEILPLKKLKFSDKNTDILHISAQNIDCGHSLEPPRF